MIFDSTDRSLSLISKNTIFPNFSPQFIVQFDQIPKDISKIPKFPVDSTRIYHYTPQFSLNSQIGKFGIIFDAIPREIDDLAVSSRHLSLTIVPLLKGKKIEVKNEEVHRSGIVQLRAVTPADNSFYVLLLTWTEW